MTDNNAYRVKTSPDPFEAFYISQAFRTGNLVMLSGHAAISPEGEIVGVGDFDAQADQTFRNVEATLAAAGSSLEKIIKVNIYMTDMSFFPRVMELRQKWFSPPYPADTIVEVKSLAIPELMIEIEATALIDGETLDP